MKTRNVGCFVPTGDLILVGKTREAEAVKGAKRMMARFGDDALAQVRQRAREMETIGKMDCAKTWWLVADIVAGKQPEYLEDHDVVYRAD